MDVYDAMMNAVEFLESMGYVSGYIHDDLKKAAMILLMSHPRAAEEEL